MNPESIIEVERVMKNDSNMIHERARDIVRASLE